MTLRSIKEIDILEEAYIVSGGTTLGLSYSYLKARIDYGFRDLETCSRFLFLSYYSRIEPEFLTGLQAQDFEADVEALGGYAQLHPELQFFLLFQHFKGLQASKFNADETTIMTETMRQNYGDEGMLLAANAEYLFGVNNTLAAGYKNKLEREIHARYNGRGVYGSYMIQHLISR